MKKKVAVVTGGSSGIGEAIAQTLLKKDYCVLANGRSIRHTLKETENLHLDNHDLLDSATSQLLLDDALSNWHRCDILCVNAGTIESNSIEHLNIDKMCEMVRLKVEIAYRLIYTFLKHFKKMVQEILLLPPVSWELKPEKIPGLMPAVTMHLKH